MIKAFVILILTLALTGCVFDSYHAFDFPANSDADCSAKCEGLMRNYSCFEAAPSFSISTHQVNDGPAEVMSNQCSCFVRACWR